MPRKPKPTGTSGDQAPRPEQHVDAHQVSSRERERILEELLRDGSRTDAEIARLLGTNRMRVGRVRQKFLRDHPEPPDGNFEGIWSRARRGAGGRSWTRRDPALLPTRSPAADDADADTPLPKRRHACDITPTREPNECPAFPDLILTRLPRTRPQIELWRTFSIFIAYHLKPGGYALLLLDQDQLSYYFRVLDPRGVPPLNKRERKRLTKETSARIQARLFEARLSIVWIIALKQMRRIGRPLDSDGTVPWGQGRTHWQPVAVFARPGRPRSLHSLPDLVESPAGGEIGDREAKQVLIEAFSAAEATILDPFMEDSSVADAASRSGRHFHGCARNPAHRGELISGLKRRKLL